MIFPLSDVQISWFQLSHLSATKARSFDLQKQRNAASSESEPNSSEAHKIFSLVLCPKNASQKTLSCSFLKVQESLHVDILLSFTFVPTVY